MTARTSVLPVLPAPSLSVDDNPARGARRRFGAIVSTLAVLAAPARRRPMALADEFDDAPMRRANRVRRLLGRLPVPGKSRSYTRTLR